MEKGTDLVQKFYAEDTNSTAHGSFLQSARVLGCLSPPPPSTSKDVQYKSGTSIFSTNKDMQCEESTSSVQINAVYKQSTSPVKMISSLWQAAKINKLENVERNL